MTELEKIARAMAIVGHAGQFRRDGKTQYYTHPEAVAAKVSEAAKPVAWLHDLLEDNKKVWSYELIEAGMPIGVISAVVVITKKPGQNYFEYIEEVRSNSLAREVKIADIEHNLSQNPNPQSIPKYHRALEILRN